MAETVNITCVPIQMRKQNFYIPIIMEAIGTDFTYSIEGVTDGEVDAAEVPFGDFDFSELNYDEEEFDKMFEKLNRDLRIDVV